MPFVMNLACINYRMKPNEALVAATLNSARTIFNLDSMKRSATHGSIEVGKVADFVIINANRWENIIYQFGLSPIHAVIKKGKILKR